MSKITIQSINFKDEKITVFFEKNWFQDDIEIINTLLLNKIPKYIIKEKILGADRESVRFQWDNTEFVLNFDYYSQSCWFSPEDKFAASKMQALFTLITLA